MYNSICSPELSFNMSIAEQPHVYVAYVDGEKDCVPLSFVYKFPKDWRENSWDTNYLFKVFWSPEENDSPSKMLKRVAAIPTYEKGTSVEKPGYYRAAVIAVKETLKELDDFLNNGKRISVGLLKYKYSSFDRKVSIKPLPKQLVKPETQSGLSSKPNVLKNKKPTNKTVKKKGIDLTAQSSNTASLRCDLAKRYPNLLSKPIHDDSTEDLNSTDDCDEVGVSHPIFDEMEPQSSELQTPKQVTPKEVTPKEITPKQMKCNEDSKPLGRRATSSLKKCLKETSSSSESENERKKLKFDPDFTPRKYEEAKNEIAIHKNSIKRIQELNLKLQEKVNALETKNEQLELKVKELESSIADLKNSNVNKKKCSPSYTTSKQEIKNPRRVLNFENKGKSPIETLFNMSLSEDSCEVTTVTVGITPEKAESEEDYGLEETTDAKETNADAEVAEGTSADAEVTKETDPTSTSLQLCDGVTITPEVRKLIFSIPPGEKKDIKFIKDLATAAFGPEVLASCSIFGTLKGKKNNEPKVKKEALNKTILDALKDQLVQRVAKAEKISSKSAQDHARCQKSRFFSALRDAQKRWRALGYGSGVKPNEVTTELIS